MAIFPAFRKFSFNMGSTFACSVKPNIRFAFKEIYVSRLKLFDTYVNKRIKHKVIKVEKIDELKKLNK